jgi:cytochrome c
MKRLRTFFAAVTAMLSASFLFGYIRPFGNAEPFDPSRVAPLMTQSSVPQHVRAILSEKCADCHSNSSRTPVYAHFAPGSWLIERDMIEGRAAMNLSLWQSDSGDQQEALRAKIAHEAQMGTMPPVQYWAIHWNARLSPEDVRALMEWAGPPAPVKQAEPSHAAAPGDQARGRQVFEKRCTGCHALNQDCEGPHLSGVYGRKAGTVSGFDYSDGLKNAHIVWSEETLERWLTDPQTMVPGAAMDFYVKDPEERADVIAFLKQQSGK